MSDLYEVLCQWFVTGGEIALFISCATVLIRFIINCATGKEKLL